MYFGINAGTELMQSFLLFVKFLYLVMVFVSLLSLMEWELQTWHQHKKKKSSKNIKSKAPLW